MISFEEKKNEGIIDASIGDRFTNSEYNIQAQYIFAADGSKSIIRRSLGIPVNGLGTMVYLISIYFHADLSSALRGRKFAICHVNNQYVNGTIAEYGNNRHVLAVAYHPEDGQTPEEFSEQRCIDLVRAAVGLTNLEPKIKSILPWELGTYVADQFQKGRVFLADDAAHIMPPTGAFGANTGNKMLTIWPGNLRW